MSEEEPNKGPYESVLVGYFCQAVGWIVRDSADRMSPDLSQEARIAKSINLSHNPFDPAVGDLLLHMDATETLPSEFFVFELKRHWMPGIQDERRKFRAKHDGSILDAAFIRALITKFPKALTAHIYGALCKAETGPGNHHLLTAPYWASLTGSATEKSLVLKHLRDIVSGACNGRGFGFDELTAYIEELNKNAATGSMAASGSMRFAVAYRDQALYSFGLDAIRQLQMIRDQRLDPKQGQGLESPKHGKAMPAETQRTTAYEDEEPDEPSREHDYSPSP